MKGLAYVLEAPEHGRLRSEPVPEPGPNQVLVRVRANGVCASDLVDWTGPLDAYPARFGHEPVGAVVAAGAGVRPTLAAGTWVTGRITPSFSEFAIADVRDVSIVPESLDPDDVLGEPVGCVIEAFRRTRLAVGARVVIVGTGFMGLVMIQLLARSPAARVTAIEPRPDARGTAVEHGADDAMHPDDPAIEALVDSCDVVIEASGTAAGLALATRLARAHGTITLLGYHQGVRAVRMDEWNWKALDIVNGHVRDAGRLRESVDAGLRLQAGGRLDPAALITHRFSADRIDDAFGALRAKPDGFVKAVITFSSTG